MSRRYKPKGWRGESHRHYLAAKGIKTKNRYYKPKTGKPKGSPWMGKVPEVDDFGREIEDEFIDGAIEGSYTWAIMAPETFEEKGKGLGLGRGQRYKKVDGKWIKVEG